MEENGNSEENLDGYFASEGEDGMDYEEEDLSLSFEEIVSLTMMIEVGMTLLGVFLFVGYFFYTYLYF